MSSDKKNEGTLVPANNTWWNALSEQLGLAIRVSTSYIMHHASCITD